MRRWYFTKTLAKSLCGAATSPEFKRAICVYRREKRTTCRDSSRSETGLMSAVVEKAEIIDAQAKTRAEETSVIE